MNMMSDAEKADLLSDIFGRMLEIDPPESKRQRVDLDKGFIVFLVNQMRIEIETIPESKKRAFMEAYASEKCSADEFSDARLERFLRCEGMNVKVQKFINLQHTLARISPFQGLTYPSFPIIPCRWPLNALLITGIVVWTCLVMKSFCCQ